ncbi:MAG: hypothetical protein WC233_06295 [Sphaerochaeta sp.]
MKKFIILMGCALLVVFMFSCDEQGGSDIIDLEGQWRFDDGWEVTIFDDGGGAFSLDIDWPELEGEDVPKATCEQLTLNKRVLTGTYTYWPVSSDEIEGLTIDITISFVGTKLELKFKGAGNLDGKHFKGGEKLLSIVPVPEPVVPMPAPIVPVFSTEDSMRFLF